MICACGYWSKKVSPTSVTTSFECLRRAILKQTLPMSGGTNQAALLGTMKHELFERALLCGEHSVAFLLQHAQDIVKSRCACMNREGEGVSGWLVD